MIPTATSWAIDLDARALCRAHAGTSVNVMCQRGIQQYLLETVGKGFYEVIGTLQADGSIQEMNCVFMGENLGAHEAQHATPPAAPHIHSLVPLDVCVVPLPRTACCRADTNMYVEMVKLSHQFPNIF